MQVIAQHLKTTGNSALRKELNKGIRDATAPAKAAVKASASAALPRRGGLASLIAKSRVTNKVTANDSGAKVTIRATNAHDIAGMNEGRLRHLCWGHKPWRTQSVRSGWFTDPIQSMAPQIHDRIEAAMDAVAKKI